MNPNFLEFEQPIAALEAKIEELRLVGNGSEVNISEEIRRLQDKSIGLTESIFKNLTSWQISQLARHPHRPYTLDYLRRVFTDFDELHGDRTFADDAAIVAVHRNGERVREKIGDIILRPGDTLLLQAGRDFIQVHRHSQHFYLASALPGTEARRYHPPRVPLSSLLTRWSSLLFPGVLSRA